MVFTDPWTIKLIKESYFWYITSLLWLTWTPRPAFLNQKNSETRNLNFFKKTPIEVPKMCQVLFEWFFITFICVSSDVFSTKISGYDLGKYSTHLQRPWPHPLPQWRPRIEASMGRSESLHSSNSMPGKFSLWTLPGVNFTNVLREFFGDKILGQKLLIKCWWNWLLYIPQLRCSFHQHFTSSFFTAFMWF